MIWPFSVEGSLLAAEPSMISTSSMEGSVVLYRTIHEMAPSVEGYRTRFHTHYHSL